MKRKKRKSRFSFRRKPKASPQLLQDLKRADQFIEMDEVEKAIDLLKPYAEQGKQIPDLHISLGAAYAEVGDVLSAIEQLEIARSMRKDAELIAMLGALYGMANFFALALDAYRQAEKRGADLDIQFSIKEDMALWEEDIRAVADNLGISFSRAHKGLILIDRAQLAINQNNFAESIHLSQEAQRYLGDFPPALNNRSLAYFYHGEPQKAIKLARQMLDKHPNNLHAMGNLIRFLVWTGGDEGEKEAHELWERLQEHQPYDERSILKKAEAAAIMQADQTVYDLINSNIANLKETLTDVALFARFLAVAAANLGKTDDARKWFHKIEDVYPADMYLKSLNQNKPGLGLSNRYPYFGILELIPRPILLEFFDLIDQEETLAPTTFRQQVNTYLQHFPQLLLVGKKMLWELEAVDEAITLLSILATPQAYAILQDFALGKKGDEDDRLYALQELAKAEIIPQGETIRFWSGGEWKLLQIRSIYFDPEKIEYAPEVVARLKLGYEAMEEEDREQAEIHFKSVIEIDPNVKEAYNNLAAIQLERGNEEETKKLLQKAIAIAPTYIYPRCNLARLFLRENKIKEAEAILEPIIDLPDYHPHEFATLAEVQARIHIAKNEFTQAKQRLEAALRVEPSFESARDMLAELEKLDSMGLGLEIIEKLNQRLETENLRYRQRQQRKLKNPHPTLAEALSIYSKDQLKAMARHIAPEGGWSARRKQELLDLLIDRLQHPDTQHRLFAALTPQEQKAFAAVQAHGGMMLWDEFDKTFGNDMKESPYWNFHQPQSTMGKLRIRGLLVEAKDGDKLVITIPVELRDLKR